MRRRRIGNLRKQESSHERRRRRRMGVRLGRLRNHGGRLCDLDRVAGRAPAGGEKVMTESDKLRRRTRRFMIGAFAVAAIAFTVIAASGISENLVYYWTPTDLRANGQKAYGATIRL